MPSGANAWKPWGIFRAMAIEPADPFVAPDFEDCFAPAERCWCGWSARQPSQYSKHYYCCARCGTHYAAARIRPAAVRRFYGFQNYWRDRNRLKQHERFEERAALFARQGRLAKWLEVITRHQHGAPGTLLEIGCAEGTLLAALHQRGWRVTGLEPDPVTAAAAQEQTGLAIRAGVFPCPLDLPPLDAVVALDVIEHAADPRAFLEAARRLLKPDGFLFLQTPLLSADPAGFGELNNRAFDAQEHAFLFSRDSVADLLAASGFGVVENNDAWSVAHEIVVARPRAEAPASPRPLGNLAELFSPPWAAVAEELAAFAVPHGLAVHVRSPRAWEYPWLWLQGLSSFDWRGRHVVDLGSEISPWPWWLATHGARVTLVEVRRDWLPLWQRLRSELGVAVDWVFAGDDVIPLPDACADVVTSVSVLEHQSDQPRAVAELARVLRPGGWLGFTCDIFEPSLGMTYPEWNGRAIDAAAFEDWVWRRPDFGRVDSPAWNWADVAPFLAWFNRTAPHHNYAMAAALLQKKPSPLPPVAPVPPPPATLVATPGSAAGTWAAAPWLERWSSQEANRRIFWVVPLTELARLGEWLPAAQMPPCDFTAAPRLAARQLARWTRAGLILLPAPLAATAPWDAGSAGRLLWWSVFLAEFSWEQAVVPAGSSDWLAAFTAAASRAPQRCGPELPPETSALLHPLLSTHGSMGRSSPRKRSPALPWRLNYPLNSPASPPYPRRLRPARRRRPRGPSCC
jgi:2-polyprenyl-3-methyl-5-hydroxy-6-metoxy-1,4-benzoquinol methylase